MRTLVALAALLLIATTSAAPLCKPREGEDGLWITVKGQEDPLPCASTTRYWDGYKGSCNCGTGTGNGKPYPWQYKTLTAAANSYVYGKRDTCTPKCGMCYSLTPTGGFVKGKGSKPKKLKSYIVQLTNKCSSETNQQWCASPNTYGYAAHFALMDYKMNGIVKKMGWNNPEVYYQMVPCPKVQTANFKNCRCDDV